MSNEKIIIALCLLVFLVGGMYVAITGDGVKGGTTPSETALLSDEQARQLVRDTIVRDLKYKSNLDCLTLAPADGKDMTVFTVTRKFNENCSGDPTSAPAIPTIGINKITGEVWIMTLDGEFRPAKLKAAAPPEKG